MLIYNACSNNPLFRDLNEYMKETMEETVGSDGIVVEEVEGSVLLMSIDQLDLSTSFLISKIFRRGKKS